MAEICLTSPNRTATIDPSSLITGEGNQTINGTLTVNNTTSHSTVALTPSNGSYEGIVMVTDGQNKSMSFTPSSISSVYADEDGTRNQFTYSINSVSKEGEISINVYNSENTVVGGLLLSPKKITMKYDASNYGDITVNSDGTLSFSKVVKGVTPTDATDKSQLVTIEYLESVLQG